MVQIGALCYSHVLMHREELKEAILSHPQWKPEDPTDPPIFDLYLSGFIAGNKKTKMLFVSAEKSKQENVTAIFKNLVKRWIAPTQNNNPDKPSLFDNISIPIHINGNHWVGLYRKYEKGKVTFFYPDDLNHPSTERTVQHTLAHKTSPQFYPPGTDWITCQTPNISPHSNKCGPRTILALAVLASHKNPTRTVLQPYLHGNLAQYSRTWMAMLLLQGRVELLPNQPLVSDSSWNHSQLHSIPQTIIDWQHHSISPTTRTKQSQHDQYKHTTQEVISTEQSKQPNVDDTTVSYKLSGIINPITQPQSPTCNPGDKRQSTVPISSFTSTDHPPQGHNPRPDYNSLLKKTITRLKREPKQTYIQLTLPSITTKELNQQTINATWGHHPEQINTHKTLRVIFQNPRGLKLTTDPIGTQFGFSMAQAIGAGALCLAETNVNWSMRTIETKFKGILQKTWQHTSSITSNTEDNFSEDHQPGGTLAMVCGNWTYRVIEKGTDPFGLGRWTYIVLRGKGASKILLVSAYRVFQQSISTAGETTAMMQQFRSLSKKFRKVEMGVDPKPRMQFIIDLQAWLEEKTRNGYSIILALIPMRNSLSMANLGHYHSFNKKPLYYYKIMMALYQPYAKHVA
jgi:hypothetical protein